MRPIHIFYKQAIIWHGILPGFKNIYVYLPVLASCELKIVQKKKHKQFCVDMYAAKCKLL